jgi:hypothetical protein
MHNLSCRLLLLIFARFVDLGKRRKENLRETKSIEPYHEGLRTKNKYVKLCLHVDCKKKKLGMNLRIG